jgi:hypothetical protein
MRRQSKYCFFLGHCSTDAFDMAANLRYLNQTRLSQLPSSISMTSMDSMLQKNGFNTPAPQGTTVSRVLPYLIFLTDWLLC